MITKNTRFTKKTKFAYWLQRKCLC